MLPASFCAKAISNFLSICSEVNIFNRAAKPEACPFSFVYFIGKISLLEALRVNSRPS